MEKGSKRKVGNKVVQKGEIIILGKAQEKIVNRRANKVVVAHCALIKANKVAYNAIVRPWLSMFRKANKIKSTFKQNYKAKWVILAGLFKKLKKFIKNGKSKDIPLAETISWQVVHLLKSFFLSLSKNFIYNLIFNFNFNF